MKKWFQQPTKNVQINALIYYLKEKSKETKRNLNLKTVTIKANYNYNSTLLNERLASWLTLSTKEPRKRRTNVLGTLKQPFLNASRMLTRIGHQKVAILQELIFCKEFYNWNNWVGCYIIFYIFVFVPESFRHALDDNKTLKY